MVQADAEYDGSIEMPVGTRRRLAHQLAVYTRG
jgi:hypothetical protein